MYLSHISITIPHQGEDRARQFYVNILGLREIVKPESLGCRGGVWLDAGGVEVHLSVARDRNSVDTQRHFGLGCGDVEGMKARLKAADVSIEDGPAAPWNRFFVKDPFGNLIEIHAPRAQPAENGPQGGRRSPGDKS